MVAQLRVLPIPSAHPYPLRLRPSDAAGTRHLEDPEVEGRPPGQWWPPPALQADWVEAHGDGVDVVHLHFGFDASSPAELTQWCDALDVRGIPLVLTVHDLVNPHFVDQRDHLARLDVLVPRAAQVLTLTPAAAARIAERWGRDATVVPHPHLVPFELMDRPDPHGSPAPGRFVVGLHLKSLRANVAVLPLLPTLVDTAERLPGARVSVHLHREVLDPGHPRHDAPLLGLLRDLADDGRLDLTVHDPHSDDQLWAYLRSLDLSVLPYAFGTHSGWLEACHDLGTAVLAPTSGLWTQQQDCVTFAWPPGQGPDLDDLARGLVEAYRDRRPAPPVRAERELQLAQVVERHDAVYRATVSGTGSRWSTSEPA